MSILEVNHVSIRYMTGDFKEIGLKEFFMRKLTHNYKVVEFWADRDVTFSLEKGDMLGIIGTNGAGKSTLLKVISGIMEPTQGFVCREGSIAALLELGSGFDGDLTVRENTYLRGPCWATPGSSWTTPTTRSSTLPSSRNSRTAPSNSSPPA